ncbi:MAG: tetratricopeptide repeat-containing sensor histidine kinase [Bacteroidetes bacterium]|nr:tetratricopeptide repeat-containing sensor histidine kinase [Bacteroidota bacterium]
MGSSQTALNQQEESHELINFYNRMGDSLKFTYPDTALFYYSLALVHAIESQNLNEQATIKNRIGGSYYVTGDYFRALKFFTEALTLSQQQNDTHGIAVGLNNIGLILNVQEKYDQAIDYHKRSIVLCRQVNDSLMEHRNLFNLGITFNAMGAYDSALVYAQKAISYSQNIKNTEEELRVYNLLGEIYYNLGEYRTSFNAHLKVLQHTPYDNNWEKCYALTGIARAAHQLGYPDEALKYALQSRNLATEINALYDLKTISKILSDIYLEKKDYQRAFLYYVDYKAYSDSLFDQEKEREMNYLHFLQKEIENKELQYSFAQKQKELENKNLINIYYFTGGLLFLLLAILLWRNLALKNRMNVGLTAKNNIIARKNQELEQVNATKDRFFHMVAHDLKSPLSAMISFTDILQQNLDQFSEQEIRSFLNSLYQSSSQGFRLLENLLDWARLQSGAIEYSPDDLKILPLIDDTLLLLEPNAKEKQIAIETDFQQDLSASIDRNMFLTVLRNLVSNAIKFSGSGKRITIKAEKDNQALRIQVLDQGKGMSKEEVSRLFKIESHFTTPGTNNEQGTGIGLILCYDLTRKMGGELLVDSTLGVGSTFTMVLPQ